MNTISNRNLLSKEVSIKIQELIIKEDIKPNEKLPSELELCEIMGVSRSTIREAVKILVSNNVVYIKRGKGTFLSENPGLIKDPLGVNFMNDVNLIFSLFETRVLIEPQVANLASKKANADDLAVIEECVIKMEKHLDDGVFDKDIDLEFHIAIAKATKNPIIQRIIPIINESIVEGYTKTSNIKGSHQKAAKWHRQIFEAIKNKESKKAEDFMREHLKETLNDIKI